METPASSLAAASDYAYQVGGSLSKDDPTYIVRQADIALFNYLQKGEFCYVFNSRQMGKSSLRVRAKHKLEQTGFHCASIDLSLLGSENLTPAQWYKGISSELWLGFGLVKKVNLIAWYRSQLELSPVQQLCRFFEDVLLKEISGQLVIFIDEVDSVLSLDFPVDDFFALIRACYNLRADNDEFKRLTFALFGVATPSDLIQDSNRTPFNLGKAISLEGFKPHEAQALAYGLHGKVDNPQATLKAILCWTNGQPLLTQKLCQLVREQSPASTQTSHDNEIEGADAAERPYLKRLVREVLAHHSESTVQVATLVKSRVIEHWEMQDHPEHLKTIRDRLWRNPHITWACLELYQQMLDQGAIPLDYGNAQVELLLSGLVVRRDNQLVIHNRIYEQVFNRPWVAKELLKLQAAGFSKYGFGGDRDGAVDCESPGQWAGAKPGATSTLTRPLLDFEQACNRIVSDLHQMTPTELEAFAQLLRQKLPAIANCLADKLQQ